MTALRIETTSLQRAELRASPNLRAGSRVTNTTDAIMAMMPTTTSNSTSVNPPYLCFFIMICLIYSTKLLVLLLSDNNTRMRTTFVSAFLFPTALQENHISRPLLVFSRAKGLGLLPVALNEIQRPEYLPL